MTTPYDDPDKDDLSKLLAEAQRCDKQCERAEAIARRARDAANFAWLEYREALRQVPVEG